MEKNRKLTYPFAWFREDPEPVDIPVYGERIGCVRGDKFVVMKMCGPGAKPPKAYEGFQTQDKEYDFFLFSNWLGIAGRFLFR